MFRMPTIMQTHCQCGEMNLLKNIPGPFLVFLGAVSLSFGGLIVKSFEGSTLWQILFWRSFFFIIVI